MFSNCFSRVYGSKIIDLCQMITDCIKSLLTGPLCTWNTIRIVMKKPSSHTSYIFGWMALLINKIDVIGARTCSPVAFRKTHNVVRFVAWRRHRTLFLLKWGWNSRIPNGDRYKTMLLKFYGQNLITWILKGCSSNKMTLRSLQPISRSLCSIYVLIFRTAVLVWIIG